MWPKRFHETYFDDKICWCEGQHFPVLLCRLIPISSKCVFDTIDTHHPPPLFMLQRMDIWINGNRRYIASGLGHLNNKKLRDHARICSPVMADINKIYPQSSNTSCCAVFVSLMLGSIASWMYETIFSASQAASPVSSYICIQRGNSRGPFLMTK